MNYTKMHGAGNGFVLLDNTGNNLDTTDFASLAQCLCAMENTDGMILIADAADADCRMYFYNRDGSAGEMCGNGARCLARYAVEHGLASDPQNIKIRTAAGIVTAKKIDETLYEIRLNDPSVIDLHRDVPVDTTVYDCFYAELGNPGIPHAVCFLREPIPEDLSALRDLGRSLRFAPEFPKGANVTFVYQNSADSIDAITYERGVEDFTLACGTGCGAAAAAMVLLGRSSSKSIRISMPGGLLTVSLSVRDGTAADLFLTGPTAVTGAGTL